MFDSRDDIDQVARCARGNSSTVRGDRAMSIHRSLLLLRSTMLRIASAGTSAPEDLGGKVSRCEALGQNRSPMVGARL